MPRYADTAPHVTLMFLMVCMTCTFAGCIVPPMIITRTPGVTGRVVDSATGKPIAGAKGQFVNYGERVPSNANRDRVPVDSRVAYTDANGDFSLERTRTFVFGVYANPHAGGGAVAGIGAMSFTLRVEYAGYDAKIVNVGDAFDSWVAEKQPTTEQREDLLSFKGRVPLGDISLSKSQSEEKKPE